MSFIAWIGDGGLDAPTVGGKARGLDQLATSGIRVPEAFAVTTECFRAAQAGGLREETRRRLADLAGAPGADLDDAAGAVRELILAGTQGHGGDAAVRAAYRQLCERAGQEDVPVAVRSSSTAEDAASQSFAGEHDSYLWVIGEDEVSERVRQCWASLFTARAVSYRAHAGGSGDDAMGVVVQRMVDARSAGVFMTLNPANGDRSKVVIESVWGLGEPLVSAAVTPDRFTVDKVTRDVLSREIADKPAQSARDPHAGRGIAMVPVPAERRGLPSLADAEIAELVALARAIERSAGCPQDCEFAVAGDGGPENVFLVQTRPETVWSARAVPRAASGPGGSVMAQVIATLTTPATATPAERGRP